MRQCDHSADAPLAGDPIREMVCKLVIWVWRFKCCRLFKNFIYGNELRKREFRFRYNCVFAGTGTRDHDRFEVQVEENSADGNRTIKRRTATRQVFQEQAFD
jgi:hypothetical protein